jgi:hypothetical protein
MVRRAAVLALIAAGAIALAACDGGSSEPDGSPDATATPAVAPEEALRLFVQRRLNQSFVANCDEAQRPDDVGKQCARLRGERDGYLAYELGPTFGEFTRIIILERAADAWTIAHSENYDPDDPAVAGIPWPLHEGAEVVVTGTGDCLRVRARASVNAPEIGCIDDGIAVTVLAGPQDADGFQWWQLEGYEGWVAGDWLRYPEDEATPTPAE